MKKTISLVIAAAMLVSIGGCGKKTEDSGEVPTLTWYVPGSTQEDMSLVMEEANKIIESKIGAKLDLQLIDDGSYQEKMGMMYSSKENFDLCFVGYNNSYNTSVQLGALMPIKDLLKEYAPNLMKELPEYVLEVAYIDGEIYAVPNMQIMANTTGTMFFKDVADKYGITEGMTYSNIRELEPYLQKIKENEPDMYPIVKLANNTLFKDYWLLHQSPYIYMNKETHEIKCFTEMEETKEYFGLAREWNQKGYTRPDIDIAISHQNEDMKAGRYAAFPESWKPGCEADRKQQYGRDVLFVPDGISTVNGGLNAMTGVSKTSKNPEKAIQLLELVNTDKELYNLICWGIEGKHYEKLDGEYIRPDSNSGYYLSACWKCGDQFNSYLLEGQAEDVWETTKKVNDEAEVPLIRSFRVDNSKIKTYEAQGNTLGKEYNNLHYGLVENWEEKLTEYNERLNTAGQQIIKEEIKKQFDEWYAKRNENK